MALTLVANMIPEFRGSSHECIEEPTLSTPLAPLSKSTASKLLLCAATSEDDDDKDSITLLQYQSLHYYIKDSNTTAVQSRHKGDTALNHTHHFSIKPDEQSEANTADLSPK